MSYSKKEFSHKICVYINLISSASKSCAATLLERTGGALKCGLICLEVIQNHTKNFAMSNVQRH